MRTLYFPIETVDREIDFRILLASKLSKRGRRIVIGHGGFLNQVVAHVRGGLYLGKSLFWPHQQRRLDDYNQAKRNGFRVAFLDEEGAVYPGRETDWKKALDTRIDPRSLAPEDVICTWGKFQGDYYRSRLVAGESSARIEVTGHPKFDTYKADFRPYFENESNILRARLGEFVLINTNLSLANHAEGGARVFSALSGYNVDDPAARETFVRRWSYYRTMHAEFVALVHYLAPKLDPVRLVVRPHPSEDESFYATAFRGLRNVTTLREGPVTPWILASSALIHDGCTTAVEAHLANKKTIRFNPVGQDEPFHDRFLPNAFGLEARSREEVLELVRSNKKGPDDGVGRATECGTRVQDLLLNLDESSFARLEAVVEDLDGQSSSDPSPEEFKTLRQLARRFALLESAKTPIRLGTKSRRRVYRHARHKFPGFGHDDIQDRLSRANRLLGQRATVAFFSPYLIIVETP